MRAGGARRAAAWTPRAARPSRLATARPGTRGGGAAPTGNVREGLFGTALAGLGRGRGRGGRDRRKGGRGGRRGRGRAHMDMEAS